MIRLFVPSEVSKPTGAISSRPRSNAAIWIEVMRLCSWASELLLFNGQGREWLFRMGAGCPSAAAAWSALSQDTGPDDRGPDLDLLIAMVKRGPSGDRSSRRRPSYARAHPAGGHPPDPIPITPTCRGLRAIATEAAEQTGGAGRGRRSSSRPSWSRYSAIGTSGRRLMFCDEAGDDAERGMGGEGDSAQPVLKALSGQAQGPWASRSGRKAASRRKSGAAAGPRRGHPGDAGAEDL